MSDDQTETSNSRMSIIWYWPREYLKYTLYILKIMFIYICIFILEDKISNGSTVVSCRLHIMQTNYCQIICKYLENWSFGKKSC